MDLEDKKLLRSVHETSIEMKTKLDLFLPILSDHTRSLQKHEKDINRGKGVVAFIAFLGTILGLNLHK